MRNTIVRWVSTGITVGVLAGIMAFTALPAEAQNAKQLGIFTGITFLGPHGAARLKVVNVDPNNPNNEVSSCALTLHIVDDRGNIVVQSEAPFQLAPGGVAGIDVIGEAIHDDERFTWDKCGQLPVGGQLRIACPNARALRRAKEALLLTFHIVDFPSGLPRVVLSGAPAVSLPAVQ